MKADSPNSAAVHIEALSFTYAGARAPALRGINASQRVGEMIGVMGASGAGKSTLAKVLNRIIPELEGGEFAGVVMLGGRSIAQAQVRDLAGEVGMVFQDFESQLFSTTVAHEVAFAMERVGMPREEILARLAPALDAVGLRGFEERDPTTLSGGQKQRLAIASVLALRPRVVVLDEPTTDLDPEGRAEVFALIRKLREQGLSLIVIEHESEELRGADRIIVLREGEIVADDSPRVVFARTALLEECGVRPPGLGHALRLLEIDAEAESVEQAHRAIVEAYPRLAITGGDALATANAEATEAQQSGAALVEVENVSFSYSGPRVLDAIDLGVEAGDFVAIVGQNGSGKTTLAKQIVGLLHPAAGRVMLSGKDRAQMRPAESAREVAYVFQNPDHQIFAATVEEEIAFGPRNFGLGDEEIKHRCEEVLVAVGLQDKRQSDPFLLSKGERQRIAVASVLVLRPRMLILDEPTTGLDHREQLRMMALVRDLNRAGIAIVIITHTPWLVAEYARRVVLLRKGAKIFDGGVREFFMQEELLRSSSFRAPEITELSRRFGTLALNTDEFVAWVKGRA